MSARANCWRFQQLLRVLGVGAVCIATFAAHVAADPARSGAQEFDSVSGYRIARYRAPVPQTAPGATTISAADIADLITKKNAVLLDVMPGEGARPDTATGVWYIPKPRQHIAGSVWLPDVGSGELDPPLEAYFKANLDRLTAGDKSRAIVIYCQADCWMSWNAVKRAASYGYSALYWFAEGSDGWRDWGGSFADAKPVAMTPSDAQALTQKPR